MSTYREKHLHYLTIVRLSDKLLAAKSGKIPNLEDSSSELEAILRIVA